MTIHIGDNRKILQQLDEKSIDLIYCDPPFNSGKIHKAQKGEFEDRWLEEVEEMPYLYATNSLIASLGLLASKAHSSEMEMYLAYIAIRLLRMKPLLKQTGLIYLHCDISASHYIKILMDIIFNEKNFCNEVIWCYRSGGAGQKTYPKKHDSLLIYGVSKQTKHNIIRVPYANGEEGREGFHPEGKMLPNWWQDIGIISTTGRERVGWPTQKPLALLERIIAVSTDKGDTVLEPFAGSGTACVAAKKLGRKWIAIDISPKAYEIIKQRTDFTSGLSC